MRPKEIQSELSGHSKRPHSTITAVEYLLDHSAYDSCSHNWSCLYSGYMAPEYAIDGLFSVKSDVFSFGILVLETISGMRNRGLYHLEHNLIGYVGRI